MRWTLTRRKILTLIRELLGYGVVSISVKGTTFVLAQFLVQKRVVFIVGACTQFSMSVGNDLCNERLTAIPERAAKPSPSDLAASILGHLKFECYLALRMEGKYNNRISVA